MMLWNLLRSALRPRATADRAVKRSLALRREGRLRDAEQLLRNTAVQFPRDAVVATNLAVVLLEQDSGDDGVAWLQRALECDPGFAPVAWDAPGAGSSSDPPESYTLTDWAQTLAEFLDVIGLETSTCSWTFVGRNACPGAISALSKACRLSCPGRYLRGLERIASRSCSGEATLSVLPRLVATEG